MGVFEGKIGECLFTFPFSTGENLLINNEEIIPLFKTIEKSKDDRSIAIMSAIIVEYLLKRLLDNYLPTYGSFGNKQELLSRSNLIPPHIIDCVRLIGKIRNKFAHDLKVNSFDNLGKDLKQEMKLCISKIPIYNQSIPNESKELFKRIQFVSVFGLSAYYSNVKILKEYIHSDECLEKLLSIRDEEEKIFSEYTKGFGRTTLLAGGGKVTVIKQDDISKKEYEKFRKKKSKSIENRDNK